MPKDKKRILHFIDSGGMYGAENVIINLSREMLNHNEYEPIVGCIVGSDNENSDLISFAQKYGIESHEIKINNYLFIRDLPKIAKYLKHHKINIIHSHGYKASVFGYFISLMTNINIMSTCHLWFEGKKWPFKMKFMVILEFFLYRFFSIVVGVSEDIIKTLEEKGLSSKKLFLVKNGIFLDDYNKISGEYRRSLKKEFGLSYDDICVVNVGRLTEQKSQKNLIYSAKKLKNISNLNFKFLIIGEGELYGLLKKKINDNNLSSIVKLIGFRNDIPSILKIADIFVLPSLNEGMPMALLEAAASRLPVVVTPVGDIEKIVTNEESGLVVPINNPKRLSFAIKKIAEDEFLRKKISNNIYERVANNYSSSNMYGQYRNLYNLF